VLDGTDGVGEGGRLKLNCRHVKMMIMMLVERVTCVNSLSLPLFDEIH
jgi:hypothetical protein